MIKDWYSNRNVQWVIIRGVIVSIIFFVIGLLFKVSNDNLIVIISVPIALTIASLIFRKQE